MNYTYSVEHNTGLIAAYSCATCFALYLGRHQACQYINLIKEHRIKSKRSIAYGHYFYKVRTWTIKYTNIRPK